MLLANKNSAAAVVRRVQLELVLGTPAVFAPSPAARAALDKQLRLRGRPAGERQLLYLLRGLMELCLYPGRVRALILSLCSFSAAMGGWVWVGNCCTSCAGQWSCSPTRKERHTGLRCPACCANTLVTVLSLEVVMLLAERVMWQLLSSSAGGEQGPRARILRLDW
jgi:hypothetical protein